MRHLSQQALESYLWGAATILRGLVDAGDYKQYIFPVLFYKRLSDVWDEEYAAALAEVADKKYALDTANDQFAIPRGAHWNDVRAAARDVGRTLQNALRAIEAVNPGKLDGIFGDAPWTNKERLPDATLKNLVEHFSSEVLSLAHVPEDELGNGYEFLIKKFADDSGHTAQEFYTNRTVVHLMAQMLAPKPGERIYDPTCGTGGMLISALAEVKRRKGEHRTLRLYGQERNHMTASIARMNLVLHGVGDFEIARGDTLASPAFVENDRLRTFDVVLANPPYSIKQWNREAWQTDPWGRNQHGLPPQGMADFAFIQHILASLDRRSGRCAILLPHGVLFRIAEQEIRTSIIEADLVEAVIGLGRNLFYNSGMPACVLVCHLRKAPARRHKILFIDASDLVGEEAGITVISPTQIDRIWRAYEAFDDEPGFAKVVAREEVLARGALLRISAYVSPRTATSDAASSPKSLREAWTQFDEGSTSFWDDMSKVVTTLDSIKAAE